LFESLAGQVLHDEEVRPVDGVEVVKSANVRVLDVDDEVEREDVGQLPALDLEVARLRVELVSLVFAVRFDLISRDTQLRAMGVMMGLVLVVTANTVPKMLKPLSDQRCEASQAQALQRFTGWALVLAGLGHAIAWLVLPMSVANLAAMSIVAGRAPPGRNPLRRRFPDARPAPMTLALRTAAAAVLLLELAALARTALPGQGEDAGKIVLYRAVPSQSTRPSLRAMNPSRLAAM
jgi:hypothetical protein